MEFRNVFRTFVQENDEAASVQCLVVESYWSKVLKEMEAPDALRTRFFYQRKQDMEPKLTLDPNIVLKAYKALGSDDFVLLMLAAAYYVKYHRKLPKNFDVDLHPEAFIYFTKHIQPVLDGKPDTDTNIDDIQKTELLAMVAGTTLLDAQEIKTLTDMLELWWNRKGYARTEMIYTQTMAFNRTGIEGEKFAELRKWLKAEGALNWENRPYGDYLTSYHTFNEARLYQLLKEAQQ